MKKNYKTSITFSDLFELSRGYGIEFKNFKLVMEELYLPGLDVRRIKLYTDVDGLSVMTEFKMEERIIVLHYFNVELYAFVEEYIRENMLV